MNASTRKYSLFKTVEIQLQLHGIYFEIGKNYSIWNKSLKYAPDIDLSSHDDHANV